MANITRRVVARIERRGDKAKLVGHFISTFKRPQELKITLGNDIDLTGPSSGSIMEGSTGDVGNVLNGLAQVAWDNGWRPAGLGAYLGAAVAAFKPVD